MQIKKPKFPKINGEKFKIAIVLPYFNETLGLELLKNTKKELLKNNVQEKNIQLYRVSGALEIPFICKKIIKKKKINAIIALGVIIRGETNHYELVTENTYKGIMQVQLEEEIPIIFGVLGCENIKQAEKRINEKKLNKGKEFANTALLQAYLNKNI